LGAQFGLLLTLYFFFDSKYHKSLYTYAAIVVSFVAWFLSVTSPPAFWTGFFVLIFTAFTICCRVHRFVLLFAMLMALACMVLDFVAAADKNNTFCIANGGDSNCSHAPAKMLGTTSGLLWAVVAACLFKIPATTPNDSDGNEMVGMNTTPSPRVKKHVDSNDVV
jgi:hypothetical protein